MCAIYGEAQGIRSFKTYSLRSGCSKSDSTVILPIRLKEGSVLNIIDGVHKDRPNTLREFGTMIFYNPVSAALSDWIFQLGLQAAGWSTAAVANTWLDEEKLFSDLETIHVPTAIFHGLNDQVCLYPLAMAQHKSIRNSRLIPFESCGHFLFYDRREKFNEELLKFLDE